MVNKESKLDFATQYRALCSLIDSLSPLMRMLLFVSVVFITYFIWFGLAGKSQQIKTQLLREKIANMQTQIQSLHLKSREIISGQSIDVDVKSIADVQKEIETLNQQIQQSGSVVFSVKNMGAVLREMLSKEEDISLLSVKHVSSQTLIRPGGDGKGIFQQDLEIVFEGDYFATLRLLQHIEQLKWRTFFDQLTYKVLKYPVAKITIKLHTLSREGK